MMQVRRRVAGVGAVILVSVGAVDTSAAGRSRPHIVGGFDAPARSWQDSAALVVGTNAEGPYFCTGSLIAARWVLTARHCVVDATTGLVTPAAQFSVAVGNQSPAARSDWLGVSAVYPHDAVDVALLRLATPSEMPTLDLVMPGREWSSAGGQTGLVLGWGATQETPVVLPTILQEAAMTIQPDAACSLVWGATFIPAEHLCAGTIPNVPATCHGDSGGPLVVSDPSDGFPFQVGVTSFGSAAGCTALPSVFSKTDPVRPWIVATAGLGEPTVGYSSVDAGDRSAVVHVAVSGTGADYLLWAEYGAALEATSTGVWVHGDQGQVVDVPLTGLVPGAETPYRINAWSSYGQTIGADMTVTTEDYQAPVVRVRAASGRRRQLVRLVWSITDDSGIGGVDVSVFNGKKRLTFFRAEPFVLNPANPYGYFRYRIPGTAPKVLRWCVEGVDQTGNRSARRCAKLTTRA